MKDHILPFIRVSWHCLCNMLNGHRVMITTYLDGSVEYSCSKCRLNT